jgi:hypothetical protein
MLPFQMENGKPKPRWFSLIRYSLLIVETKVCRFSVCCPFANGLNGLAHLQYAFDIISVCRYFPFDILPRSAFNYFVFPFDIFFTIRRFFCRPFVTFDNFSGYVFYRRSFLLRRIVRESLLTVGEYHCVVKYGNLQNIRLNSIVWNALQC